MSTNPVHNLHNESARLQALRRYDVLDTPPESKFDDITRLASMVCGTPVSLITLIDETRQWFKSKIAFDLDESARELAFCAVTILDSSTLVIEDAAAHPDYCKNPLVTGPPHIRFYAGAPLVTPDGYRIGTLCVIDHKKRKLDRKQLDALQVLAEQVMTRLELRRSLAVAEDIRKALVEESEHSAQAELSRNRAESFMRSALDSIRNCIAIIDRRGKIVRVNQAWHEKAGERCGPGLIAGTGNGTQYLRHCEQAAKNGAHWAIELASCLGQFLEADASEFDMQEDCCCERDDSSWFAVSMSAFGAGTDRHVVLAIHDVSERVAANNEIRELNTSLERRVERRTSDLASAYSKLQRSEEQLRSLFDNAKVGVFVGSPRGELLRVNDAYVAMTGQSRTELIGCGLLENVHEDDRVTFGKRLSLLGSGESPGFEMDIRSGGSTAIPHWRHLSISAVRDSSGAITQLIGLAQDLRGIKESELQRNMIFNRSLDLLVIAGPDGKFHVTNRSCSRVLGYSRDELCSLNYFDIIHEDDSAHAQDQVIRMANGEDVELLDIRVRTKGGEIREIIWNCMPWTEEGLFLGVGRDVTSLRAADRAIREQDLMLRRAEQIANIGSWQYEFASGTAFCSDGLRAIVGRDIDTKRIDLEKLLTFVAAENRQHVLEVVRSVRDHNVPRKVQFQVFRPDGTTRTVETSVEVVRNGKGQVYGIIGACLDITDINETIERLRQSESQLRALGRRLEEIREDERAHVSREIHDELGQMLTALKFDLTLLAGDVAEFGPERQGREVHGALRSMAARVDTIIHSVRAIATRLRPVGLDAFGLVPALQLQASEFEKRTQIECIVNVPAELPRIPADTGIALYRIAQEAMTNAARHAGCSRIMISINDHAERIELTVADNGRGVRLHELASTTSLGVVGMRERAAMIGADFDIHGTESDGTIVSVAVEADKQSERPQRPTRRASA